MALDITASTDRINHGSSTSVDNLTNWTMLAWIYLPGLTDWVKLCCKTSPAEYVTYMETAAQSAGEHRLAGVVSYGGISAYSNSEYFITAGKWWFLATSFSTSASSGDFLRFYGGDLTTRATLRSVNYYDDPTGGRTGDEAGSIAWGDPVLASETGHDQILAWSALFNTRLTLAKIQQQQFNLYSPVDPSCVIFSNYGWNGAGTQPDWSGNRNNGTVTGATVANHVPLGYVPHPILDAGTPSILSLDSGMDNYDNWLAGVKIRG